MGFRGNVVAFQVGLVAFRIELFCAQELWARPAHDAALFQGFEVRQQLAENHLGVETSPLRLVQAAVVRLVFVEQDGFAVDTARLGLVFAVGAALAEQWIVAVRDITLTPPVLAGRFACGRRL